MQDTDAAWQAALVNQASVKVTVVPDDALGEPTAELDVSRVMQTPHAIGHRTKDSAAQFYSRVQRMHAELSLESGASLHVPPLPRSAPNDLERAKR